MSISVSLSQEERRLGLCLFPPMVNLDFGCSCGLCRFFDPGASPLLLLSRPFLLPRPRPLPLPVRFFWGTLLLPLLESTVLLVRPEAFEATEACDLADLWLAREVDLTLVLELDLPDLDVKELCLEVPQGLGTEYTPVLVGVWPDFHAIGLLHVLPLDEKRSER